MVCGLYREKEGKFLQQEGFLKHLIHRIYNR